MTITLFPDCEASSPDGRFTLEASCPGNRKNSDALQWDFRYRLLDGDRVVWERQQGDGEQPPHELWVSDEGWSILRTPGHSPQVIAISPDGRDELRVSVRSKPKDPTPGTPDNPRVRRAEWLLTRSSYSIRIGGGLYWSNDSWPYFFQVEGWSFFVWRTESGQRLVLDLTQRTLVPENSPACAALTHAMEEEEQRGAHRLLWRLAARLYEVQELIACYRPSSTKKPPPLVTQLWLVPAALQLVGLYRCEEALPVLRCWEGIDFYRPRVHSALKQLGAEPQGATFHVCPAPSERRSPVPDLGPYLRARAAELEPRMSAEQVPQPVGSPDKPEEQSPPVRKLDLSRPDKPEEQSPPATKLYRRRPELRPMTSTAFKRGRDATFEAIHSAPEWQPYIQLIDGWYRQPISADTGVPADELSQLERAAGRPLPAALWEWYRLSGTHEFLRDETTTDYEVSLERVWKEPRYLRIYGENQDNWYCGILNEDLEDPDPPVYFDSRAVPVEDLNFPLDGLDLVEGHFIPVCDKLSEFLLGLTVRQIAFRDTPSPFFRAGVCGAQLLSIAALVPLEWLFDFPAGFSPFIGEDVVDLDDWGFAARTPEALARLQQAARESGWAFPPVRQPGRSNPHDSIWVAK